MHRLDGVRAEITQRAASGMGFVQLPSHRLGWVGPRADKILRVHMIELAQESRRNNLLHVGSGWQESPGKRNEMLASQFFRAPSHFFRLTRVERQWLVTKHMTSGVYGGHRHWVMKVV